MELAATIAAATAAYEAGTPLMSDREFDALVRKAGSRLQLPVGSPVGAADAKVRHAVPMRSLSAVWSAEQIESWVDSWDGSDLLIELKIDGVAITAVYDDGKLAYAATRGDGEVGRNVTEHLLTTLPATLPAGVPTRLEIRGELFIDQQTFVDRALDEVYCTPRDCVAALLRKKHVGAAHRAGLRFNAFEVIGLDGLEDGADIAPILCSLGFEAATPQQANTSGECIAAWLRWQEEAAVSAVPADGVVIKLRWLEERRMAGEQRRAPNWALAAKAA